MDLVNQFMHTVILETLGRDWKIIHKSLLIGIDDDVEKLRALAVAAKTSRQPIGKAEIELAIAISDRHNEGILHFIPDGYIGRFFMALSQVYEVRASYYRGVVTMERNSDIDGWRQFHSYKTGAPFFLSDFGIKEDFITTTGKSYKSHIEYLFRRDEMFR